MLSACWVYAVYTACCQHVECTLSLQDVVSMLSVRCLYGMLSACWVYAVYTACYQHVECTLSVQYAECTLSVQYVECTLSVHYVECALSVKHVVSMLSVRCLYSKVSACMILQVHFHWTVPAKYETSLIWIKKIKNHPDIYVLSVYWSMPIAYGM